MTADAAAIPDAETIVADVMVDVTMDADVTMAGVLPCLAAEEAAVPAFSGLSVFCAAAEIIMDAVAITMDAVTTAAGLSSCFCYFIKSISINYQFLLLFRFHKTLQKNSSIYNMAAAGFPSYFHL